MNAKTSITTGAAVRKAIEDALASTSTAQVVEHLENLRQLSEATELRAAQLVEARGSLLLDGTDAELKGNSDAQESAKLDVARLSAAITAAENLLAELQQAERVRAAEEARAEALQVQARAVAIYAEWDKHADHMAGLLLELEGLQGVLKTQNRIISAADLAPVALPNMALSITEERVTETVWVEVAYRGPAVLDEHGREVGADGGHHYGCDVRKPAPTSREETRVRITRPGKHVADLLERGVVIPRADADRRAEAWIERRG